MAGTSVEVGALIDEIVARVTSITDYRVDVQAILSGAQVTPGPDGTWQLRENCRFLTSFPAYRWRNAVQTWGIGTVDIGRGEVSIKVYAA